MKETSWALVVHIFNPSTQKAEARWVNFYEFKAREILSKKKKEERKETAGTNGRACEVHLLGICIYRSIPLHQEATLSSQKKLQRPEVNFRYQSILRNHSPYFSFVLKHVAQAGLEFAIYEDDLNFHSDPHDYPRYWDYKHTPLDRV